MSIFVLGFDFTAFLRGAAASNNTSSSSVSVGTAFLFFDDEEDAEALTNVFPLSNFVVFEMANTCAAEDDEALATNTAPSTFATSTQKKKYFHPLFATKAPRPITRGDVLRPKKAVYN
jgi:hypothetical protein